MNPGDARADSSAGTLEALVDVAAKTLSGPTVGQLARGERAIRLRLTRVERPRHSWSLRIAAAAALCTTLFVLGWGWSQLTRVAPLQYRLEDATMTADLAIHAMGARPPVLRFSDGTQLKLEPATKARIRYLNDRGAALAVDEGRLRAEVVHSSRAEWRFDVGPYVVNVTGTTFEIAWAPEQDRFELRLEHGSVTVHAPVANAPIPVRAGQWLTIRSRSNEVTIRDLTTMTEPASSVDALPEPEPPTAVPESSAGSTGNQSGLRPHEPAVPLSWVKDLRLGHLEQIIADAQQRGLEHCINTVNSEELSALADAARYSRRNDIARFALSAQRRRFPGSNKATEAAFLLGKLSEAERNGTGALQYFDLYLREAPAGRYAGEALGRKMAIIQQSAGSAAAKPIAAQYLTKYPSGTYAEAARAIVNGP